MRIVILLSIFIFSCAISMAQGLLTLHGRILDESGAPIPAATIVIKEFPAKGVVADANGEYSIKISQGEYSIVAASLGFLSDTKKVKISDEKIYNQLNFKLLISTQDISAVTVTSRRWDDRVTSIQIGAEKIHLDEMAKTPALFGEKDVVKSMTLLPGVKAQGDGQSGIMVRGGSVTQNLMLLDNAPVHNLGHALGLFSVINGDALSEATLYKGLIPAQYGGGAASVFDIKSRSGDMREYKFGVDIGILSAKATAEGPIVSDKLSFFATARRSYFDLFLKLTDEYSDTVVNFYDINAAIKYNANKSNIFTLTLFNGGDNLGVANLMDMDWGNLNGSLNWFHRYSDIVTSNTTFTRSGYDATTSISAGGSSTEMSGAVTILGLQHEFLYSSPRNTVRLGGSLALPDITTAEWQIDEFSQAEQRDAFEGAVWINDEWKAARWLTLSAGVRLVSFTALGGSPYYTFNADGEVTGVLSYDRFERVKNYLTLEPRVSSNFRLSAVQSIKAGYARTSQSVFRVENNSMSMPFTRFTMASNYLKPQISDQFSLGFVQLTNDQVFEFSAEGYYKKTQNAYDYRDGKSLTSDIVMESLIVAGEGRSYGVEMLARKNKGLLTGWVAYTLAWSDTKIPEINGGDWYAASNDMRNSVSIVGMCPLSRSWGVAASWVYSSGRPLTAPSAKYQIDGKLSYYFAERNGYVTPAYHRLDVSFTNRKVKPNYTREWTFGVFNLYNHLNPFIISFEEDTSSVTGTKTVQYSLYGVLPSVTYGIKF